jgi:hypothetical protein
MSSLQTLQAFRVNVQHLDGIAPHVDRLTNTSDTWKRFLLSPIAFSVKK